MKDKEIQVQIKLKELELKKSTPVSTSESSPSTASAPPSFDVSRQVRLVPQLHKQEMDKFFLHFKKVVTSLHWPPREVYSALSVEQSADYEVVKREILEGIVPEAYCQQLRELKCKEGQTYMEFAQQKEALFNRWCTSQQVGNSFDKLKQLVLLEEV